MTSPETPAQISRLANMSSSTRMSLPVILGRTGSSFARWIAHLVRMGLRRREIARLGEFDERMLKDIGLTRNDVVGALEEPWHRDPSAVLMIRALERRVQSRARMARARKTASAPGQAANEDNAQGSKRLPIAC